MIEYARSGVIERPTDRATRSMSHGRSWALVTGHSAGRYGRAAAPAEVGYYCDGRTLLVRTSVDELIRVMCDDGLGELEVRALPGRPFWSVTVIGAGHVLGEPAPIREAERCPLPPRRSSDDRVFVRQLGTSASAAVNSSCTTCRGTFATVGADRSA